MSEFDKTIKNVFCSEHKKKDALKMLLDIKAEYLELAGMLRHESNLREEYQYIAKHIGIMCAKIKSMHLCVADIDLDELFSKTTYKAEMAEILFGVCAKVEELTDFEARNAWNSRE